jgi:pimeloyl-ACP methyl ester carboxylesterase
MESLKKSIGQLRSFAINAFIVQKIKHKLKEADSMNMKASLAALGLGLVLALSASHGFAQTRPEYIPLGGGVKGVLYRPDSNPSPNVAVIIIHRTSNYLQHAGCTQLSQRGLMVLCMNSRFDNNEALVNWELIALDVRRGVDYLRNTQKISKVILFGHSGGGPTTTYYQAVAEKGPAYCQGANKLSECESSGPNSVAGLPPADGIILADAHPGNTVNALRAINGSVREIEDKEVVGVNAYNGPIHPMKRLNPFDPANGFNPNGKSTYSKSFQRAYNAAQADRMNDWINQALRIRALMAQGQWRFPDNDSIIIARGGGSQAGGGDPANLFVPDTDILCCTEKPQKLLQNDGSIVTQIVKSVRLPNPNIAQGNEEFDGGTKNLTVTAFLSANAIRATDSMDYKQIDWCSTNNSTPCALQHITVPILITAMGAHYFHVDAEQFYENYAASADKEFVIFAGMTHGIGPCNACPGGPYNNQVTNYWNYLFNWIKDRFGT